MILQVYVNIYLKKITSAYNFSNVLSDVTYLVFYFDKTPAGKITRMTNIKII